MPTATSLSGWRLLNNGPLTTTFTAPASCSTAYRTMIAPATDPAVFLWGAQCPWLPPADCNPSGDAIRSLVSSAAGPNPSAGFFIVYHSPGFACPAGWPTVGAAARPNPSSISISGAFNQSDAIPTYANAEFFEPQLDVFLAALDPDETAILCCPSSYTATDAGCYSALPRSAFTPTVGCGNMIPDGDLGFPSGTWTLGGEAFTGVLITITATTPLSSVTTSFAPSEASSLVGVAVEGMFILVHQSSDIVTGKTSAASSTSTSASTSTSKQNSAVRVRGSENGLGFVAAVCCLSFVLGALFVG